MYNTQIEAVRRVINTGSASMREDLLQQLGPQLERGPVRLSEAAQTPVDLRELRKIGTELQKSTSSAHSPGRRLNLTPNLPSVRRSAAAERR
jgi:hypothetical protein